MAEVPATDNDIIGAIKMLEGIESSTNVEDINTYKTNTRNLFEQLLLKLEENSDLIYSLEHRVKFLEQECEDKDLDIEKMTISMQEAVNDCRQEAEEMVGELMGKVSVEVNQRHEIEGLVRRLQLENAKLKDYAALQKVPGWEKSLNSIIEETTRKETRLYQSECDNLRVTCDELEQKLVALQLQREAELNATVVVIKVAQQKIEALHLQLKYHQKKEQQEQQQNGNSKKKGKKNQNSFNTPQKDALTPERESSSASSTPNGVTPSPSPTSGNSKKQKPAHGNDKALHNKRNSRGKKGGNNKVPGGDNAGGGSKSLSDSSGSDEKMSSTVQTPTTSTSTLSDNHKNNIEEENNDENQEKETKVTPEVLIQKSKSFWGVFNFKS